MGFLILCNPIIQSIKAVTEPVSENTATERIIIIGPTASGKSDLAAMLARRLGSLVISADARQCYKELDIGTAKPGEELLQMVEHKYVSLLEPDQRESASAFRKRADEWESGHRSHHPETPVVYAGGSTLYIQSLLFDLDDMPTSNPENMAKLQAEDQESGIEVLYERLKKEDPDYVAQIDGMNRHRIYRALDVWMQTGKPFSSFHKRDGFNEPRPGSVVFQLEWPRAVLHERINQRVNDMIAAGLTDEVRNLLEKYPESLQSLQTVGYREVISFLKGDISREQMVADIKTNTRRYAKRQLTWFRRWPFVKPLDAEKLTTEQMMEQIISVSELGSR